jgi:hypothetical protein
MKTKRIRASRLISSTGNNRGVLDEFSMELGSGDESEQRSHCGGLDSSESLL